MEHSITHQDVIDAYDMQGGKCYWFGVDLRPDLKGIRHPLAPSLDRLDPTAGYVKGNVVISSYFANMGRGPCPAEEFGRVLRQVSAAYAELTKGV
jgi:hypothetical protein